MEFEILFFEDDTIILSSEKYNEKQIDCTNIFLYKYDLLSKETKFITKIENFYSSPWSMELVDGELYFPYSKLEGKTISNFIMNIDINSLDNEEVSYGKKPENAIRIESASNMILKHYQIDKESDATDYYVDFIKDGKNRNIIKLNYSSGNGELLIDIFGEKDKIYIYTLYIKDSNKNYVINQYDLNGNLEDKIELELDSFLDLPEVKDKDIVYNIYKINDYIILHTLNGRNRILKQEGRKFITIDIPKKLEDFNEGQVSLKILVKRIALYILRVYLTTTFGLHMLQSSTNIKRNLILKNYHLLLRRSQTHIGGNSPNRLIAPSCPSTNDSNNLILHTQLSHQHSWYECLISQAK